MKRITDHFRNSDNNSEPTCTCNYGTTNPKWSNMIANFISEL